MKRLFGMFLLTAALVLVPVASAGSASVRFAFSSGFRASPQEQNFVIVGPAGTQTFLDIFETNVSSVNIVVGSPDLGGDTSAFLVSGAGGKCVLDPSNPNPGLLAPGEQCVFFYGVTLPQAKGVYRATFTFPVYSQSRVLLEIVVQRVMLISV